MPQRVSHTTHLVKHSVSKTQQLPEEVEPAVQEGKETQQKKHNTYDRETERGYEEHFHSGHRSQLSRKRGQLDSDAFNISAKSYSLKERNKLAGL